MEPPVCTTSDPVEIVGNEAEEKASFGILERPKRPLSAYNLFFRDEREKLLQSLPSRESPIRGKRKQTGDKDKCHRKIDFSSLAKTIASRWKQVDDSVKKEYESVADAGRRVYNEKAQAWREQRKALGLPTKREAKKKAAPNKLSSKVKQEVAPPSKAHHIDSQTRPDLGPFPRRKRADPPQHVSSVSDYPASRPLQDNQSAAPVNYFPEVRTTRAEPVAAFSASDDYLNEPVAFSASDNYLNEPVDPFADGTGAYGAPLYGQQRFPSSQLDFPNFCQPRWTSFQQERVRSVLNPSFRADVNAS